MRTAVSINSVAALATFAMVAGSVANASYPVQNLADLQRIKRPFQANAVGATSFTFTLPAIKPVQFLALIRLAGAAAGNTVRIRLWSDNNPDPVGNAAHIVHDSTAISVIPGGGPPYGLDDIWPMIFPYALPASVNAQSGRVDLSASAGTWQIGGLEISGLWAWTDSSFDRENSQANRDVITELPFNSDAPTQAWSPRTVKLARSLVDQSEARTTAMDFFGQTKMYQPFVYCWDVDDSATYPRECILMRNATINGPQMLDNPGAKLEFDFVEHMR